MLVTAFACERESCEDPVPSLLFEEFQLLGGDSLRLIYDFKDCDGNVGLSSGDTLGSFAPDSYFHFNLRIDMQYRVRGEWQPYPLLGEVGLNSRIPNLPNDASDDLLEGKIDKYVSVIEISQPVIQGLDTFYVDTIRFDATLIDRNLNESNIASSPPYIL